MVTFISTVIRKKLNGSSLGAAYWWRNVRDPVRWKQALQAAIKEGYNLFIEMSPRPILSKYGLEVARSVKQQVMTSPMLLREKGTGRNPAQSVAHAVAHGIANVAPNAFTQAVPSALRDHQAAHAGHQRHDRHFRA